MTGKIAVALLALTTATGCANKNMENVSSGMLMGAGLGMVAGGFAGSYFGGGLANKMFIASGVVTGGVVGAAIGRKLEASDRALHDRTAGQALAAAGDGETVTWSNPETGSQGMVRPTRSYTAADGKPCREYRASVARAQDVFSGAGLGCQQADGRWQVIADEMG